MKCLDPTLCYTDPTGKRFFRSWSLASDTFRGYLHQLVFDCGKCIFCRKKKSVELAMRCVLHASLYAENCFLTLTYDEKKEGYHNAFEYPDIQKFKKRLRQHIWRTEKKRVEIFNVHEYGKNGKKHWHLILFNYQFKDRELYSRSQGHPLYTSALLSERWGKGFVTIGDVSEASAMYQAQYTQKDFKNGNVTNDKKSHSKHSGLGKPYFLKHYSQILSLGYIPFAGKKVPIPRYFLKLAHRHWSHYNEPINFFDTNERKALYRPFPAGEPDPLIAQRYGDYVKNKQPFHDELVANWNDVVSQYLQTKQEPEFVLSAENALYDLKNRNTKEKF